MGRLDPTEILEVTLDTQVQVPAGAQIDPLHDRAHEGEVSGVELAESDGLQGLLGMTSCQESIDD